MKKNGFTLIELLAVLSIMAVILLVAVPSINNQLKKIKENNYNQFKDDLFLAAESYVSASANDYPVLKKDGGQMCIRIQDLIEDGWVKSTLVDPDLNKTIGELEGSIVVRNSSNKLTYVYDAKSSTCSDDYTSGNS